MWSYDPATARLECLFVSQGATFSSGGQWLFVNIQTPGITFAITGPWAKGTFGGPGTGWW